MIKCSINRWIDGYWNPWTSQIKSNLENIGLLNIYLGNYSTKNPYVFKKLFQRLCDIYYQETFEKINVSDKQNQGHPPLIQDSDTSTNTGENLLQKRSLETNKDAEIYVGKENCEATEPSNQNYEELDKKIKALLVKSDSGIWHCKECDYKSQYKGHVKGHVEKHIPGYIYPCHLCSKMFKRRVNLKLHLSHCGT